MLIIMCEISTNDAFIRDDDDHARWLHFLLLHIQTDQRSDQISRRKGMEWKNESNEKERSNDKRSREKMKKIGGTLVSVSGVNWIELKCHLTVRSLWCCLLLLLLRLYLSSSPNRFAFQHDHCILQMSHTNTHNKPKEREINTVYSTELRLL